MNDLTNELNRLGDSLERAVDTRITTEQAQPTRRARLVPIASSHGAEITRQPARRRRHSRRLAVVAVAGTLLVAGGAAAAAGVFSTSEVERGMPAASKIFTNTDPTCTTTDGIVFDCVLTNPPTKDIILDALGEPVTDFSNFVYDTVDDQSIVNGGCRAQDPEGLYWTCYLGERAVEENIIDAGLLGTFSPGQSVG